MLVVGNDVLAGLNFDRATVCMVNNDFENALIYLDAALDYKPDDAPSHWNKAMCLLSLGRYPEGFSEFEHRWGFVDWPWRLNKPNTSVQKPWVKDDLAGKRLLLVQDGGRGDVIMMMRFVPQLVAMGAQLTALVMPELRRLVEQRILVVVTEEPDDLSDFDLICPMFSLVHTLRHTVKSIPNAPYLTAAPRSSGRRFGICWSGVSQTSLSLPKFLGGLHLVGDQCQALQPGDVSHGVKPFYGDFKDLAEIIMGLDHVITVDTAAANLAGALGHPSVHLLLRTVIDFRWHCAKTWYPLIKNYRQKVANDWSDPFAELRAYFAIA